MENQEYEDEFEYVIPDGKPAQVILPLSVYLKLAELLASFKKSQQLDLFENQESEQE